MATKGATQSTLSKREMLLTLAGGAAATCMTTATLPAVAGGPDPVHSAIATYQRSYADFCAFSDRLKAWEKANPSSPNVMLEDKPMLALEVDGRKITVHSEEELALAIDGVKRGGVPDPVDAHCASIPLLARRRRPRRRYRRGAVERHHEFGRRHAHPDGFPMTLDRKEVVHQARALAALFRVAPEVIFTHPDHDEHGLISEPIPHMIADALEQFADWQAGDER
jgi:hypothetical protein